MFAGVCGGEVILVYVDEVHVHRDLDLGYTWGRQGERLWRASDCPKRSDRMNAYGAYDFTHGECLLWQDGWCDGERTVQFSPSWFGGEPASRAGWCWSGTTPPATSPRWSQRRPLGWASRW